MTVVGSLGNRRTEDSLNMKQKLDQWVPKRGGEDSLSESELRWSERIQGLSQANYSSDYYKEHHIISQKKTKMEKH